MKKMKNAGISALAVVLMSTGLLFGMFQYHPAKATDPNDPVICRCGLIWGKGCKADNYGSRCNGYGDAFCTAYDSNCEPQTD